MKASLFNFGVILFEASLSRHQDLYSHHRPALQSFECFPNGVMQRKKRQTQPVVENLRAKRSESFVACGNWLRLANNHLAEINQFALKLTV